MRGWGRMRWGWWARVRQRWGAKTDRKRQKGRDRDTEGVAGSVRPRDPFSWEKRFRHPLSILWEQRIFLLWDMGLLSRVGWEMPAKLQGILMLQTSPSPLCLATSPQGSAGQLLEILPQHSYFSLFLQSDSGDLAPFATLFPSLDPWWLWESPVPCAAWEWKPSLLLTWSPSSAAEVETCPSLGSGPRAQFCP